MPAGLFDPPPGPPGRTPDDPESVLRDVFGYRAFRPGQREVIDAVLAGHDCIAIMPTGAGKSLTFQLPARMLPGSVLVIGGPTSMPSAYRALYWAFPRL